MKSLVVGAGKSGVAAANFLARRGEDVVLSDSNPSPSLPYEIDDAVVRLATYEPRDHFTTQVIVPQLRLSDWVVGPQR